MDAMEYLTGNRLKMHEVYTSDISLSFCTVDNGGNNTIGNSLQSIHTIASEIGFPYEIIFVTSQSGEILGKRSSGFYGNMENLYFVRQKTGSLGQAMKVGFDSSTNKYFVPFRPDVVYDVKYADLIHSFLMRREKKLFLSELPVIHRDLIKDAGGYRNLSYGFDIDLYSRIAMVYGVVACPAMFNNIPLISPPPGSPSNEVQTGGRRTVLRRLRDHIIACNYSLEDLLALYGEDGESPGLSRRIILSVLYALSRTAKVKPFRFDRNNYLILMENVFESLILKDFARYGMDEFKANMILSREEIRYLKSMSRVYRDVIFSMNQYVVEQ